MPGLKEAYMCLSCQMPVATRLIQGGGHSGHVFTDMPEQQRKDDTWLMRLFRQKMQEKKRDLRVWLERDF